MARIGSRHSPSTQSGRRGGRICSSWWLGESVDAAAQLRMRPAPQRPKHGRTWHRHEPDSPRGSTVAVISGQLFAGAARSAPSKALTPLFEWQ